MASINDHTHHQPVVDETINSMHQSQQHEHPPDESPGGQKNDDQPVATTTGQQTNSATTTKANAHCCRGICSAGSILATPVSGRRILNDVDLIRYRRVKFNHVIRKQMELICEEKISKNKLEEAHSSIPSSIKITIIMSFSPDGQRVASIHSDHRIYICDLNTGKFLYTLEGHPKTPMCLAWHPTNREILASGCLAGEVRVWDLKSKACESCQFGSRISSLDFHPKERVLVVATENGVHFWDWSEPEPFAKTTTMHALETVRYVLFDSTGTKLITGISNSPRYNGYVGDSHPNRIIDALMSPGSNLHHHHHHHHHQRQQQAENMTQNSESTTSSVTNRATESSNSLGGDQQLSSRSSLSSKLPSNDTQSSTNINTNNIINNNNNNNNNNNASTNNEQDVHYGNTMTLSRVASLYRQLEALEDSMRNTSFTPYMSPRLIDTPDRDLNESNNNTDGQATSQRESGQSNSEEASEMNPRENNDSNHNNIIQSNQPPTNNSNNNHDGSSNNSEATSANVGRTPNTFKPYLVAFDESLEQLQLSPLIVDGQPVSLATIIERYPLDVSRNFHYEMQMESIEQVNQNDIRISKLMNSSRLYRQIVQQIQANITNHSSGSNNYHHQANQILTAQSVSPRSSRNSANLPIVLRNFSIDDFMDPNGFLGASRTTDPVMAVQFRNTARNVPLVSICKIDLIAARALCIIRSQQLVDQALASSSSSSSSLADGSNQPQPSGSTPMDDEAPLLGGDDNRQDEDLSSSFNNNNNNNYCSLLTQLHSSLTDINHAPLTTSNVYSHITKLRLLVDKLLKFMSGLLSSPADARRLMDLIHKTAFSLTGRKWSVPLGPTYDELRLDVIHTLCIVDLTLHLVRQIQLLQMQRIPFTARIEQHRRRSTLSSSSSIVQPHNNEAEPKTPTEIIERGETSRSSRVAEENLPGPSNRSRDLLDSSKRKDEDEDDKKNRELKRRKVDGDTEMTVGGRSGGQQQHVTDDHINLQPSPLTGRHHHHHHNHQQSHNLYGPAPMPVGDPLAPSDRLFIFSNLPPSNMEQRCIVFRIYHRPAGASSLAPFSPAASIIDNSIEQQLPPLSYLQPFESRRRALSQDNQHNHHHHHHHPTSNSPTNESSPLPQPPNSHQASSLPYLLQSSLQSTLDGNNLNSLAPQHHHHHHHHLRTPTSSRGGNRLRPPTVFPVNSVPTSSGPSGGPNVAGPSHGPINHPLHYDPWHRAPHLHLIQARGQHLWYNHYTISAQTGQHCAWSCRLQCWNFSLNAIPNIKDSQSNLITQRCRIASNASPDVSSNGLIIACLVSRDDVASFTPNYDLKIYSIRTTDFGACYYKLPLGSNAVSVSLSPSGNYAVVGLASLKLIGANDPDEDLTIAKVFRLDSKKTYGFVRDIKIKRGDSSLSLNVIKWMPRGIVYNVGPQSPQRYHAARMRHVVAS